MPAWPPRQGCVSVTRHLGGRSSQKRGLGDSCHTDPGPSQARGAQAGLPLPGEEGPTALLEEPWKGREKPGCCMVAVAPVDISCSLPVSVFGFARLTLAVAFLPFGRWEVPSAVGEGPQLLSLRPVGRAPDGSVCGQPRRERTPPPLPQLPSSLPSGSTWVCSWDGLEMITSWFFQKQICPRHTLETSLWLSTYISGTNTEALQKEVRFGPDSPPLQACFPNQLCPQHLASFIPRCTGWVFLWTGSLTLVCYVVGK